MLAKNFVKVHRSDDLSGEGKIRRLEMLDRHPNIRMAETQM